MKLKTNTNATIEEEVYSKSEVDGLLVDKASVTQPSWTALTLETGYSGNLTYRKLTLPLLEVYVGILKSGTPASTLVATLPVGYRPKSSNVFHTINYATLEENERTIIIKITGEIMFSEAIEDNEAYLGSFVIPMP